MKFCVFEIIDPRNGTRIWVGAGRFENWRSNALVCYSDRKAESFAAIRAAGYEPAPRIVEQYRHLGDAMKRKAAICLEIGQAYRGATVPKKYKKARLGKHRVAA